MAKTPWFSASEKPVRKGVYERKPTARTGARGRYSYWDGWQWCLSCNTVEGAALYAKMREAHRSSEQRAPWRGFTAEGYFAQLSPLAAA